MSTEMQARIRSVCDQLKELLIKKNTDYGDSAFQSPSLAPGLDPGIAIRVRMSDKVSRLIQLLGRGEQSSIDNESIVDTFLDLAGYSILEVVRRRLEPSVVGVSRETGATIKSNELAKSVDRIYLKTKLVPSPESPATVTYDFDPTLFPQIWRYLGNDNDEITFRFKGEVVECSDNCKWELIGQAVHSVGSRVPERNWSRIA